MNMAESIGLWHPKEVNFSKNERFNGSIYLGKKR
jgi:hypothetical protein